LRQILDSTIGRVLELKNEMFLLELNEFHYFDDVLSDLKLTPSDVEMPIPKYFTHERAKALKEREKLLGQILSRLGGHDKDLSADDVPMTREEAVLQIQRHERARQGRVRAKFMREIRQQEERQRQAALRGAPTLDPELAATRIQKLWKGVMARKRTNEEREREMIFIGMTPPPRLEVQFSPESLVLKAEAERRRVQEMNEVEYQQALVSIKDKLKQVEGPDMKETMMDQIRQWFLECRDALGKFPDYPDEEDGGSLLIFKEKDPKELEKELKLMDEMKSKKDKGKKKEKKRTRRRTKRKRIKKEKRRRRKTWAG